MRAGLQVQGSCWWLLKLTSMSTINREWVALQHAHVCPFADIFVGCKPRCAWAAAASPGACGAVLE